MDRDAPENKATKTDLGPVEQISYHLSRVVEILEQLTQGRSGELTRLIFNVKTMVEVAWACHDSWVARSDENFRQAPVDTDSKTYKIKQGLDIFLAYGYDDVVAIHDEFFAGGRVSPEDDAELKRLGWSFVSDDDGYGIST